MKSRLATAAVLSLALSPFPLQAEESRAPTVLTPPSAPAATAPVQAEVCSEKLSAPGFSAATLATRAAPEFPETDVSEETEGWVRLGFTIDTDGKTKDIVALDQVGSSTMAKAARTAVARWRYKPATQDGLAVEQYGNSAEILFRAQHVGNAPVHDSVVAKYDEGRALAADGKYAEGITVLEQTFELPLTLYEQAKISFALAFAYEKLNDMPRALRHIRHALIEGGNFLEKAVVPAALRMRLRLEAANGNFHYAACAPPLPASDKFDPSGADRKETVRVLSEVTTKLANPKPLTIDATLTASATADEGGVWEHPLSRRKFTFTTFTGLVNEYRLSCVRQSTRGAPNETLQATVPPGVGPCTLRVYGRVGATFKLIEEW